MAPFLFFQDPAPFSRVIPLLSLMDFELSEKYIYYPTGIAIIQLYSQALGVFMKTRDMVRNAMAPDAWVALLGDSSLAQVFTCPSLGDLYRAVAAECRPLLVPIINAQSLRSAPLQLDDVVHHLRAGLMDCISLASASALADQLELMVPVDAVKAYCQLLDDATVIELYECYAATNLSILPLFDLESPCHKAFLSRPVDAGANRYLVNHGALWYLCARLAFPSRTIDLSCMPSPQPHRPVPTPAQRAASESHARISARIAQRTSRRRQVAATTN